MTGLNHSKYQHKNTLRKIVFNYSIVIDKIPPNTDKLCQYHTPLVGQILYEHICFDRYTPRKTYSSEAALFSSWIIKSQIILQKFHWGEKTNTNESIADHKQEYRATKSMHIAAQIISTWRSLMRNIWFHYCDLFDCRLVILVFICVHNTKLGALTERKTASNARTEANLSEKL